MLLFLLKDTCKRSGKKTVLTISPYAALLSISFTLTQGDKVKITFHLYNMINANTRVISQKGISWGGFFYKREILKLVELAKSTTDVQYSRGKIDAILWSH